eukprot:TRINITY_DN12792_c0_g1_i1.p1 TRINITY_DN12792_c0_g1~~TRINITY_DN12792_c0_g1_i1.p1  ORF type:complete len:497 (+),score=69.31 TRINITY_DN12792_c0_g1_i1:333-1823(+)
MEQWLRRVTPWVFPWSNATMRLQKIETHLHVSVVGLPDRGREVTMHHGGLPASSSWKICLATPLIIYACYLLVLKLKARRADSQLAMVQFDPMPINIMVCVAMLGGTMITVLKPFIALDFGASPAMVGVMQSSFSIAQFFGTLLMGFLSDTFGRKQLLLTLPIGHIVAHLGCAMSRSYTPFLLCRVLLGFFGGLVPIAEALIAENTVQEERAGALGRMMAFLALGSVTGPGVTSLLSPLGFANIFYIAAVLALLIWMWLLYTFDDSWKGSGPAGSKLTKAEAAVEDAASETTSEAQPLHWKMLVFWYVITFGYCAVGPSTSAGGSMIPLFALDMFGMTEQAMGVLMMVSGVFVIIFQASITGIVSKQIGNIGSCIVGLALACVPYSMLFLLHSPLVLVLGCLISTAAGALIDPTSCAAVASLASDERRGSLLGIFQAFRALGQGFGPIISGVLYEVTWDLPFQASVAAGLVFMAALGTVQATTRSETSLQSKSLMD